MRAACGRDAVSVACTSVYQYTRSTSRVPSRENATAEGNYDKYTGGGSEETEGWRGRVPISAPQGLRLQNGSRTYAFGGKWGTRKLVNPVCFNLPLHLHATRYTTDTPPCSQPAAVEDEGCCRGVAEDQGKQCVRGLHVVC